LHLENFMKVMRATVVALALLSASPILVLGSPAFASETAAIGEGGLVEILPVPVIVADGTTSVDIHVVALASNGAPYPGVKLKAEASTGEVGEPTDSGAGIYTFTYTPAVSSTDVDVTLSVKGKPATVASIGSRSRVLRAGLSRVPRIRLRWSWGRSMRRR